MIKLRMCGVGSTYGDTRNAYTIFFEKFEGKRPLGGHRRKMEDNIKMYLPEIAFGFVDWIHMAQDRDS
jgi:hypothetical protein